MKPVTYDYYDTVIIRPGKKRMQIIDSYSSRHVDRGASCKKVLVDYETNERFTLKDMWKRVEGGWETTGNYKFKNKTHEFKLYFKEDKVTFYATALSEVA